MGYISIFLGLAVVVALMIRRWSPLMVGIVAATVVIFMNGLPFGETMTGTYFDGFCTMFKSLFPPIFSGSLLAQIYNRSGAVNAVGDAIVALAQVVLVAADDGLQALARNAMLT